MVHHGHRRWGCSLDFLSARWAGARPWEGAELKLVKRLENAAVFDSVPWWSQLRVQVSTAKAAKKDLRSHSTSRGITTLKM